MAQMIPSPIRPDVKSYAEVTLYNAFKSGLSDEWVVFHSVAWQSKTFQGGARDGELDFLLAHPTHGLVALEVKGGIISYDGAAKQWMSNGNPIKDPFAQVCDNKHTLYRMLKEHPFWQSKWITISHAVAFPNSIVRQPMLLPDAPRAIILDQNDLAGIADWVEQVVRHWQGTERPPTPFGSAGIQMLITLLSPSFTLHPLLGEVIPREEEALLQATQQQFRLLDYMARHRRAAISGCAGSGKTLLAAEKARRLAAQGFDVLLTCFNKNLALFLQASLADIPRIKVIHFHGLCAELARRANLLPARQPATQEYFDNVLPELLVQAADKLKWHVDAIIVDEGQDFKETWWLSLQWLLNDPDDGIFYIFYDDNQRLYSLSAGMPFGAAPTQLRENCRNSQRIHTYVQQFYASDHPTTATGPDGRDIEVLTYSSEQELKTHLRKCLHTLVIEQRVAAEDIVVLTPYGLDRSAVWQGSLGGSIKLVNHPSSGGIEVFCTTIHQYKGLESPVVVLAEVDPADESLMRLVYVGASRACVHLIVLQAE